MTKFILWLTGHLPIGWLQLTHNKTRLLAAVGGVTFANVLIFMQLGFMNALFETSVKTQRNYDADIVLVSSDFRAMREANTVPRSRLLQALGVQGVRSGTPVYLATKHWTNQETNDTTNFQIIGIEPSQVIFKNKQLQHKIQQLAESKTAIIDSLTRDLPKSIVETIQAKGFKTIEMAGHKTRLIGNFAQGASFDVDGNLIVSKETFLQLFPQRRAGTPTIILLNCEPEADPQRVVQRLSQRFADNDVRATTLIDLIKSEQAYQASQTPIGFVFGFGVTMGLVVGLVIVYQVLATDVQDHLKEYATFKAMGYAPGFFSWIVFEEALALATLGFIPGLTISLGLYQLASNATALPITMPWSRPLFVFGLTVAMCSFSGLIATRRLNSADPANLF